MSQDLQLALIQTPLYWENATANRAMLEEKMASLQSPVDLIILPEMFTTGFTMNAPHVSEVMNTHSIRWMQQQAAVHQCALTGSLVIREGDAFYNRLIFMYPDGHYQYYDKQHLFRMTGEQDHYDPGKQRLIVEWKGWKIQPLICYDLRFPGWSRNHYSPETDALDYDLLIYVANWPAIRETAWQILLQARAIENHAYCAGVNRIGTDGNGVAYSGKSGVASPSGGWMSLLNEEDSIGRITLSADKLKAYREKFPAYLDTDN